MKRVLSLVLALVIVLGTMPMAFAADQTAGEMLQAAGLVAGDENGNLMEDQGLTRAQLAVLVAELNGVKENAKTYAIAPEFKDVKADDWFGPYVAYAAKEGWFKGDTEGNFNPNAAVSDQMMATVMLRALGYEPAWETAVSEAKAMGLPVASGDAAAMTRGEAFSTMWGVVNTPKKDSDVALGVELGKLEPEAPVVEELVAEIDAVTAIAANLVEVEFVADVDAAAAGSADNYSVVTKTAAEEVAVVAVTVESATIVVVETEALKAGDAYTVVIGDAKANFTAIKKETSAPEVDSVKGTDEGVVEITFDMMVDRATAEDVANYSIDKEGTVVAASLNSDRDTVELTVEGMTTTASRKVTVENVTNTDGVVMKKVVRTFAPKYDNSAVKLDDVNASAHNNVEVLVDFTDAHGIDKATAEDVSNYSIDGLEIISAKATYQDDDEDDYYDRVILTTEEQSKSTNYTLEVKYMVDGSAGANATTKVLEEKFRGGKADEDEPSVKSADAKTLTEVHVTFGEENSLDAATALDAGNYTFEDGEIEVVNVEFKDEDDNGNDYFKGTGSDGSDDVVVVLTVTEMEETESYKLLINNVADNFGNAMEDEEKETVRSSKEDLNAPVIEKVKTTDSLEEVVVTFDEAVKAEGAEDPTNYVFDNGVGAAKSADLSDDELSVTLEVAKLTANKTYEITINGVTNYWAYTMEDVTKKFVATPVEADEDQPEVDDVDYADYGVVRITFNEPMVGIVGTSTVTVDTVKATETAVSATPLTLKAIEGDNDEILVFDGQSLGLDTKYYVNAFSNDITDKATFKVDYNDDVLQADKKDDEYFTTDDDAYVQADDAMEVERIFQEDGRTVHVYFSDNAYLGATTTISPTAGGSYTFNMEVDDDEDDLVVLTATSAFGEDEEELSFDFSARVFDVIGRPVQVETVKVDVDNDDENGPVIKEVEVIDNETLEVTFNEPLSDDGRYSVYVDGDKDDDISVSVDGFANGDDVLTLKLGTDLEGDKYYTLVIESAPEDLAGNDYEDYDEEEFDFNGTDKEVEATFLSVDVFHGTKIVVEGDDDFTTGSEVWVYANSVRIPAAAVSTTLAANLADTPTSNDDTFTVTLAPEYALADNNVYEIRVLKDGSDAGTTVEAGEVVYATQKFEGFLSEEGVKSLVVTGGNTIFTFKSYEAEDNAETGTQYMDYKIFVKDYDASAQTSSEAVTDLVIGAWGTGSNENIITVTNSTTYATGDKVTVRVFGIKDGIVQFMSDTMSITMP